MAVALVLSYLEHLFPLQLLLPVPGVKWGLANLATVVALVLLGRRAACFILLGRCLLAALLFGTLSSLMFSLGGGLMAWVTMVLLLRAYPHKISLLGVCVGGAAAHQVGQMLVACLLFQTAALLIAYLPLLLVVSLFTGSVSGYLSTLLLKRFSHP